jgi:hypothetical protein
MYTKYNCCPPPRPVLGAAVCCNPPYVSKVDNTQPGAIPESVRVGKWNCSTATVSVTNFVEYTSSCTTIVGTKKVTVPVPIGSSPPVVTVSNTPASITSAQRVTEILSKQSDPYNPQTRFAAYFPPAPLPYICPERIPNNYSKPSTADCQPIRRFQGSAQAAGLAE